MAAIPPIHEDQPTGTGSTVPASAPEQQQPGEKTQSPPQPGPQADPTPSLPADWSPVAPSPPGDFPRQS